MTSATSGAQPSTVTSAAASSDTSLSGRYGEKIRSTQCSQRTAASSDPPTTAAAGTSNETTVPITGSACRTRAVTADAAGSSGKVESTRPPSGPIVERTLQRRNIPVARICGSRYRIDSRTLRGQSLANQPGKGEPSNLDIHRGLGRVLQYIHPDNAPGPLHDPD